MSDPISGFVKRIFHGSQDAHQPPVGALPNPPSKPNAPISSFGAFGEKGELVGEQISYFINRLDELYSLRQEFASVAKPMQDFIVSHAEAQTRLSEATALLSREQADARSLRTETTSLRADLSRIESELAETKNQNRSYEQAITSTSSEIRSLRLAFDDTSSKLEWTNRQWSTEVKSNADHVEQRRSLKDDLDRLEQQLANEKARLLELGDQHSSAGAEVLRLQALVERLQPSLAAAKRRTSELENDAGAAQATMHMLELKIASEQELRRSVEFASSQDKVALENEISAVVLKIEALEGRHVTSTRLYEQSRNLANEKIEHIRQLERSAKEAQAEKTLMDRRSVSAQEEIRRLTDQAAQLEKRYQDAHDRGAMLANALAAKDTQTDHLETRCEALKRQLDDVSVRNEQERAALQAQNRKLIEEVQSEQAERALAQGALSIARNSREKLVAQVEELRRNRLSHLNGAGEDRSELIGDQIEHSNVRILRSSETTDDKI